MIFTLNYYFVEHDSAVLTKKDIILLNNDPKAKEKLLINHRA